MRPPAQTRREEERFAVLCTQVVLVTGLQYALISNILIGYALDREIISPL